MHHEESKGAFRNWLGFWWEIAKEVMGVAGPVLAVCAALAVALFAVIYIVSLAWHLGAST